MTTSYEEHTSFKSFEPEWRSKSLADRLAYAYTKSLFTDIDIIVHFDGKDHRFKAHKNILAHFSSVLERSFRGKRTRVMNLRSVDPDGLSHVLECLYCVPPSPGKTLQDRSIILSAYHAALQLGVTRIEAELRREINKNLLTASLLSVKKGDFWKLLDFSRALKLADVESRLLTFAARNGTEVLRDKSLVKASAATVKRVIELDNLNASEVDVLDCVARWKEGNAGTPFVDKFWKNLLKCVRFRNLSSVEYCQFVGSRNEGLIPADDVLKILMHLEKPSARKLPPWCSTKFRLSGSSRLSKDFVQEEKAASSDGPSTVQSHPLTLLEMLKQQKHADVCFMVGPDRIPLKAHRNILAMGSIVFEKMFYEKNLADTRYDIAISTRYPDGFRTMIQYFYCESDLETWFSAKEDLAARTWDAALKYGSNALKNACRQFTDPKTQKLRAFWRELEVRSTKPFSKEDKSTKEFLHYASRNTKQLFECGNFLNASLDAVRCLLQHLNFHGVREIDLLFKVAEWIEHNSKKLDESPEGKYRLLGRIRFDIIAPEEFSSFLAKHGSIFSKEESLSILMHLVDKLSPLPAWCHKRLPRYHQIGVSASSSENAKISKLSTAPTFSY